MAYGSTTAEAGEELKNDKGLPDGTPTQETMVVETQDAMRALEGKLKSSLLL
jgi:hypothetical protein